MARSNLANLPQIPQEAQFQDFAPDVDPVMPGALLDCEGMYPSAKGFRSYPTTARYSNNALPSMCMGAYSGTQGPNSITLAGTANNLFEMQNKVFVNTGLVPNAISPPQRWRFDIYGTDVIAVNGVNRPYVKPLGGNWQNLGGNPPIASIVQATEFAVFLFEPNSNVWHASLSDAIWTNSIATATVSAPLSGTHGNITAAQAIRGGITIFKRKAFHYGVYQGPPLYWQFPPVSYEIGAPCQEAVANIGDKVFWPASDDFYSFDGQSLIRLKNNLKEWFFSTLDQNRDWMIQARWDQKRSLIFWHFPSTAATTGICDLWVCYNMRTERWTKGRENVEAAIFSVVQTGALTYGEFTTQYTTYSAIPPAFRYGDLLSRSSDLTGIFSTDHALWLYSAAPKISSLTSQDFGDRHNYFQVVRIQPYFPQRPMLGATCQVFNQVLPGSTPLPGLTASLAPNGWFDLINTSRLQRFKFTFNSEAEITGMKISGDYAGEV